MAFRRTAHALVSKTDIPFDLWMEEHRKIHEGAVPENTVKRIASDVLHRCNPKEYLLSHATIVASVDTYAPKGSRTGTRMEMGCQIDVRFPNFRIKPACQKIINNNGDAWERGLLLSTYKTFIGAANYLEHIQVPELSKGFIVDAIARDLGDTCYIDILVATHRKHRVLIQDILSGKMDSMSMGCISLFTTCTRCGNVASDDTQLCPHILYDGKNSLFKDEDGIDHRLAELIGHVSVPDSNMFIEASWVRNPAFTGAVRRNIINGEDANPQVAASIGQAADVYEIRRSMDPIDGLKKVARRIVAEDDPTSDSPDAMDKAAEDPLDDGESVLDAGVGEEKPESSESESSEPAPSSPGDNLAELVNKAQEMLLQSLVNDLGERMAPKPEDVGTAAPGLFGKADMNDNLMAFDRSLAGPFADRPDIRAFAMRAARAVVAGPSAVAAAGLSARDIIVLSWISDAARSQERPALLYKAAMTVGPVTAFPSERSFLAACGLRMGRRPTAEETRHLLRLGRLASISSKF